ncbi:MAG: hypothetical protein L3J82_06180 [Planctomycetes bacterium]|nr:hypothetical protein [Planctomycetota bacterium]
MKSIFTLMMMLFASHASACLWDNDTLYEEEQGVEDIRDVIVGNFIRNPPRYFEMRLERVSKLLETDVDNLDLYDNASVACDRLHKFDEAIAWQEKKLAVLERLNYDGSKHAQPNHHYRHLANIGTHYAHRWLLDKNKWDDLADIETARGFVAAAIDNNPDAHFGREIYQLLAIDWLLRGARDDTDDNSHSPHYIQHDDDAEKFILNDPAAAAAGFAGMIRLGGGWKSIDLFAALAFAIANDGERTSVAYLAIARVRELYESGMKPLFHGEYSSEEPAGKELRDYAMQAKISFGARFHKFEDDYTAYLNAVQTWQDARLQYMGAQFKQGKHPDTHNDFWEGFSKNQTRTVLPSSEPPLGEKIDNWWNRNYVLFLIGGFLLAPVILAAVVILLILRRGRKKKKALPAARASA